MNINEMSGHEKSVMLVRLCGIKFSTVTGYANQTIGWQASFGDQRIDGVWGSKNLYDPANMALALRCIRWGIENNPEFNWLVAGRAYHILKLETGIAITLDAMLQIYGVGEAGLTAPIAHSAPHGDENENDQS